MIAVRKLIKRLAESGRAIVLTSHNMTDIETPADRIYLIGNGRIHYRGSVSDVKKYAAVPDSASLADAYLAIAPTLKRKLG
ncbi:hypothetical protein [Lactobacillus pasteurii]|uniref:hypothetical protein n=1 Tax=Lactobacillus pasteurii TaxID=872327 RepID=UPI0010591AD3|nr:hypothetical protein [Lactobacillus pasteurii]